MFGGRNSLHVALTVGLLFAPVAAFAGDLDKVIEIVEQRYKQTRAYQADFVQKMVSKLYGDRGTQSGKVYFEIPGKMRWDFLKPEPSTIVTDGKTFWFYQPSVTPPTVFMSEAAAGFEGQTPTKFLSGLGALKEDFKIELDSKKGDVATLLLIPNEPMPQVERLYLVTDLKSGFITRARTVDFYGSENIVDFTGYKSSADLDDKTFQFVPPKGVHVMRQQPSGGGAK